MGTIGASVPCAPGGRTTSRRRTMCLGTGEWRDRLHYHRYSMEPLSPMPAVIGAPVAVPTFAPQRAWRDSRFPCARVLLGKTGAVGWMLCWAFRGPPCFLIDPSILLSFDHPASSSWVWTFHRPAISRSIRADAMGAARSRTGSLQGSVCSHDSFAHRLSCLCGAQDPGADQ